MNIFNYTDYRKYISDQFEELKQKKPHFSYRFFNRKAGIKSSGFLKLVMDGKRNLGSDGIEKIGIGFDLNDKEKIFFENLVHFNQAKDHDTKDNYFKKLLDTAQFKLAKPISHLQYNIFTHWYYVAILEMIRMDLPGKKDAHFIADHIKPKVTLWDIKRAIKDLIEIDVLEETSEGELIRKEKMLTTDDEVQSVAVANFHIKMSELAIQSVKKDIGPGREFSALTSSMSEETFRKVKKEIQDFRNRLHHIIEGDNEGLKTMVGHINFQLFQLSQTEETSK